MCGVSLNWGGFDNAMKNAAKKLANKKLLMATIGEALVAGTQRRFQAQKTPDGQNWKPSGRAATEGGMTLSDSGHLRKSIDYAATPDKVMVGSNAVYSRIHQVGGVIKPKNGKTLKFTTASGKEVAAKQVNIPARPYLGVSTQDKEEIKACIQAFLKGAFK